MISLKTLLTRLIAFLSMAVVFAVYWPGLTGGFIFDDYYSLQKLAILNGELSFSNLWSYIMAADTGPLKRPISVLSFILNAQNWPVDNAFWFKLSNVMIHVLNTLLLIILLSGVFKLHKQWHRSAFLMALAAALLWSLNPYLVSTVLYVIQRMAMLPLSFGLLMMILYLYQRVSYRPSVETTRWLLMTGGFNAVLLLLATLSKENGILFIYLLALFELLICGRFLGLPALKRRDKFWLIQAPVIILTLMIVFKIPDFLRGYELRNFSLWERLLSEFRAVCLYLKEFFVPGPFSQGVFVDGFVKSTGLFSPITTLTSIILVVCLLVLVVLLRHRFVWFSFAFGFFFISQLLESTFIPLELIFEHRVYIASVFLPVPIVFILFSQIQRRSIQMAVVLLLISVLAVMTYQKSKLWGNELQLHLKTAQTYPKSTRATIMSADLLSRQGQNELALQILIQASDHNKALQLKYNAFLLKCDLGVSSESDFERLIKATQQDTFTKDDFVSIHYILEKMLHGACGMKRAKNHALRLVGALKDNSFYDGLYGQRLVIALELYVTIETNDQIAAVKAFNTWLQLQEEPVPVLDYVENLIRDSHTDLARQFYHLLTDHYLANRDMADYTPMFQKKYNKIKSELSLYEPNHL